MFIVLYIFRNNCLQCNVAEPYLDNLVSQYASSNIFEIYKTNVEHIPEYVSSLKYRISGKLISVKNKNNNGNTNAMGNSEQNNQFNKVSETSTSKLQNVLIVLEKVLYLVKKVICNSNHVAVNI